MMLVGEHAVLRGAQAIVVAINRYIEVNLSPRTDRKIEICSAEFGIYLSSLDECTIAGPYEYILTAIKSYWHKIGCGFTLEINSGFSANVGFGSSAAVTVATLGVLAAWLEDSANLMGLYKRAVKVVRLVQGAGSGADVAASVFGGVVSYKIRPLKIQKMAIDLPVVAVYSGYKTSTSTVIAAMETRRKQFPKIFSHLYTALDHSSRNAVVAIRENNIARLGQIMNIQQGILDALGVNNATLMELVLALRAQPGIYGAKISGAGLGDCILGVGNIEANTFPQNAEQKKRGIEQFSVAISQVGFSMRSCNSS